MKNIVIDYQQLVKSKLARWSGLYGALIYGLFYLFCVIDQKAFSYMGVESSQGASLIKQYFLSTVILSQVKILCAYLLLGLVMGRLIFLFWLVVLPEKSWNIRVSYKISIFILSILIVEKYFLYRNILKYPQLYSAFLYERQGAKRFLQLFITNNLTPAFFNTIGITVLLIFIYYIIKKTRLLVKFLVGTVLFSILIVLVLFKIGSKFYSPTPSPGPNIIIISADSLRADYINKDISNNIYNIANKGVNFTNCFVSLPRTFPQWITFLKSQYPATHGVRNMFPDKSLRQQEAGSLNSVLKQNGYTTAVVSDFAGDVFSRFNIGFDLIKAPYFNFNTLIEQRSLEIQYLLLPYITNSFGRKIFPVLKEFANNADPFLLEEETEQTIKGLKGKPFFLTVFFSTTHFPYVSCYPYYKYYTDKEYQGLYKYYKPNIPGEPVELAPKDLEQVRGLYKGAVSCLDEAVGKLLVFLKKQGLDKNTIIIVLADHGEQLYENSWGQGHGEHLRGRAVLNIPFIIYDPREKFKNNTIKELVRDIDLAPTMLNLLSLPVPKTMEGINLLPLMHDTTSNLNLVTFAETGLWFTDKGDNFYQKQRIMYPDIVNLGAIDAEYNNEVVVRPEYRALTNIAKHRMIYDGRYKLIYVPTTDEIIFELYDTKNDPDELHNIAEQNPEILEKLKSKIYKWMEKDKESFWKNNFFIPHL